MNLFGRQELAYNMNYVKNSFESIVEVLELDARSQLSSAMLYY